jgi:disulfide bond formation protein DsbB
MSVPQRRFEFSPPPASSRPVPFPQPAYPQHMRLLETLASAFINTFGITQPTDRTRRQVSWFIFGMLILVLCVLTFLAFVLFHFIHS